MQYPHDEEMNDIAWAEFLSEVENELMEFEHIVDEKTGTVIFNEKNVKLIVASYLELLELAEDFCPSFKGHNEALLEWDYTDDLWDAIWECWKIKPK